MGIYYIKPADREKARRPRRSNYSDKFFVESDRRKQATPAAKRSAARIDRKQEADHGMVPAVIWRRSSERARSAL